MPLTPSLSPSDGERVAGGRVRGWPPNQPIAIGKWYDGGGSNYLAGRFQKYRDALNGTNVPLLAAQSFSLESTTSLNVTDSWLAVTNVPAVVDLQNTVTNPISGEASFYRLKK